MTIPPAQATGRSILDVVAQPTRLRLTPWFWQPSVAPLRTSPSLPAAALI